MDEKGNALLIVMVITLLLTIIVRHMYTSSRSHRMQVQQTARYAVTSDKAEAAARAAAIWLESLNHPPEWDAAYVSGCGQCYSQLTDKKEADVAGTNTDAFFRFDDNGDGKIDPLDISAYLVIPLGMSAAGNCIANDGYSNACWRTHSYLIVSRAKDGRSSEVERKQEFKRQFYY